MSDTPDRMEERAREIMFSLRSKPMAGSRDWDEAVAAIAQGLRTAKAEGAREEREACAGDAERARLPKGYQWGRDAMEQFNFGKERAALAIRARTQETP